MDASSLIIVFKFVKLKEIQEGHLRGVHLDGPGRSV